MSKKKAKAKAKSTNQETENANVQTQAEIEQPEQPEQDDELELEIEDSDGISEPDGQGSSEPVQTGDVETGIENSDSAGLEALKDEHRVVLIGLEQKIHEQRHLLQGYETANTTLHNRVAELEQTQYSEATALSIIRPEVPDFTELKGVPSFKNQFAIYSDQRIAYALRKHELASAADFYGIEYGSRIREMELVGKLRTHLTTRTCRCTDDHENLIDTRWRRIDDGQTIFIGLGPKMARTYGGWFADAVKWVVEETGSDNLNFEIGTVAQMPGGVPDIYSEAEFIDGQLGTMGAAHRFEDGALDRGQPPYAFLQVDSAENWYYELFVYVVGHELLHILGLGHGPTDNVMFASVPQKLREHFGAWDLEQVNGRIPRTINETVT